MKLKDKFMKMDKTKRKVICFIILSFCFIIGYGIFHPHTEYHQTIISEATGQVTSIESTVGIKESNEETNESSDKQTTNKVNDTTKSSTKQETSKTTTNSDTKTSTKKETTNETTTQDSQTEETKTVNTISVEVTVIGMGSTMYSGTIEAESCNAYSALVELVTGYGSTVTGSSSYVTGIGGLKEKQHGSRSGWMYRVNGVTPMKSAGSYNLSDGDNLVWYYVNYE